MNTHTHIHTHTYTHTHTCTDMHAHIHIYTHTHTHTHTHTFEDGHGGPRTSVFAAKRLPGLLAGRLAKEVSTHTEAYNIYPRLGTFL
jgi:hypothetical protein